MPLGPAQMLALLEEALAEGEAKRLRKRDPAIILRGPAVMLPSLGGWPGRYVGRDEHGAAYSFTMKQVREMRDAILAAARADAKAAGLDV